jgi:hypothetical protein
MATTTLPNETIRKMDYPAHNWRFDMVVAIATMTFVFGFYLDGWAHSHGRVDTSFFTVWHAALYGAFGIVGAILVGTHVYNVTRGYTWAKALPRGYSWGLIGVMLFAIGGVADMVWHQLFGIEVGIEALYSPSHLTLAISAFLFASAPFCAGWIRSKRISGWREFLPILLSAIAILSAITFFTSVAFWGSSDMRELVGARPSHSYFESRVGITSVLISTTVYVGLVLLMLRRWKLPFGAIAVLFAVNDLLMVWLAVGSNTEYLWVGAFALSGLIVDALIWWLKPSAENPNAVRVIAAVLPFVTTLLSLGAVHWIGQADNGFGLWWDIHMWLGVPVLAALAGLLLSFVAFPPAIPTSAQD